MASALSKRVKRLEIKITPEEIDNLNVTFCITTPLNWRDIIAVEYTGTPKVRYQNFIFADGVEYQGQQVGNALTASEEAEADAYIDSLKPRGSKDLLVSFHG